MKPPIHLAMLASAGTGKTFQLTNRYIELLAAGVEPATILATTFTRKAAGEILDRILARLAAAATTPKGLDEIRKHVDPALTRERCRDLAASLVRNLHRLNIQTLDSFFARMTASLGPQMGMAPHWRIVEVEEDQALRSRAIQVALTQCERTEMLAFIQMLHAGAYGREVHGAIARAVDETYDAYQRTLEVPQAWEVFGPLTPELAPSELQSGIAALGSLAVPVTKKGEPNKNWSNGHAQARRAAQENRWTDFLKITLVERVRTGGEFSTFPIPPAFAAAYLPLIDHAACMVLTRLRDRNTATRDVMSRFDAAYLRCKQAAGGYRFDDIPRMLLAQDPDHRLHNLYFQLDARLRHLLLDEFQDTSTVQFDLLLPIIEELVSTLDGSSSLFCVGDIKQSLYAWRGGEPDLLPSISQRWPQVETRPLDRNFRSSPVILDTVNKVFANLTTNPALAGALDAARQWSARFTPHIAGKPSLPGFARLITAPLAGDGEEQKHATLTFAVARVKAILDEAPGATVGILTRANEPIARLLFGLKDLGIPASGEGGNPLVDSQPVAVAVSLLQLAHHPGDSAALFHVATSPLGPPLGLSDPQDMGRARVLAGEVRRRLAADGHSGTLAWVHGLCAQSMDDRALARFEQLIALAQAFDGTPDASLTEFITIVQQRAVEDPSRHHVRVMTVHRAKGLQFDAVILPDLDRLWLSKHPRVLLDRRDDTGSHSLGPVKAATTYPDETLRGLDPRLEDLYQHHRAREVNDEMCGLYVAMTRPIHLLEAIINPSDKPPMLCPSGVLRGALAPGQEAAPETELWRSDDAGLGHWAKDLVSKPHTPHATAPPARVILAAPGEVPFGRLRRTSPSGLSHLATATIHAADLLDVGPSAALDRGTLLHAWFELIEWLDDGPPDDTALYAVAARHGIPPPAAARHFSAFRAALQGQVGAALRRSRYPQRPEGITLHVRREWGFVVRDTGAGGTNATPTLLSGQFDRVVIARRPDGRALWAEVLDFKSDGVSQPAEIAAQATRYTPQMAAYRRAVASMLGAGVAVTASLLFTQPGVVVAIN